MNRVQDTYDGEATAMPQSEYEKLLDARERGEKALVADDDRRVPIIVAHDKKNGNYFFEVMRCPKDYKNPEKGYEIHFRHVSTYGCRPHASSSKGEQRAHLRDVANGLYHTDDIKIEGGLLDFILFGRSIKIPLAVKNTFGNYFILDPERFNQSIVDFKNKILENCENLGLPAICGKIAFDEAVKSFRSVIGNAKRRDQLEEEIEDLSGKNGPYFDRVVCLLLRRIEVFRGEERKRADGIKIFGLSFWRYNRTKEALYEKDRVDKSPKWVLNQIFILNKIAEKIEKLQKQLDIENALKERQLVEFNFSTIFANEAGKRLAITSRMEEQLAIEQKTPAH